MTDHERAKYIPSYGNRLAVLSYCRQSEGNIDQEAALDRIRQNIATRRMRRAGSLGEPSQTSPVREVGLMARHHNRNALKNTWRIEVGWLHFEKDDFHQVRSKNGGGTRHLALDKKTTVAQIMEHAKHLFFPNGQSPKGLAADFTFGMRDFKKQTVSMDATLFELYEQFRLKMLRLYLCTKGFVHSVSDSSEHSDIDDQVMYGEVKGFTLTGASFLNAVTCIQFLHLDKTRFFQISVCAVTFEGHF